MPTNSPARTLGPEATQALRLNNRASAATVHDKVLFELSRIAAKTLANWGLSAPGVVATLLAPVLSDRYELEDELVQRFGSEAIGLAKRLIEWQSQSKLLTARELGPSSSAVLLRSLLRQAYLDLPRVHFVLMVLADHDAHLSNLTAATAATAATGALAQALAHASTETYIPLTEVLGLWSLRERWIDKVQAIEHAQDYDRIESNWLGKGEQARESALRQFKRLLVQRLKAIGVQSSLRIERRKQSAGIMLRCEQGGEAIEEIISRLIVTVLCDSPQSCYQVLGAVHSLGQPVEYSVSQHFVDYIASPLPNGYRALHTTIVFDAISPRSTQRASTAVPLRRRAVMKQTIMVRILTPEMKQLNEWGVVAALGAHDEVSPRDPSWWNGLGARTADLRRRADDTTTSIQDYLRAHDLGTQSDLVYVFTPRGELVYLEQGSTPLDFAYAIHTDLGDHAGKATVNGHPVPLVFPLKNGDLVHIRFEVHPGGPDLGWLNFVATERARRKLRRSLVRHADHIHHGRGRICEALIRLLDYYDRVKHYRLSITTERFDSFLRELASARKFPSLEVLYSKVERGEITADGVVWQFVSSELSAAIVNMFGYGLTYPPHAVRLCNSCRPVPGERIVAFERRQGTLSSGLIVHAADASACIRPTAGGGAQVPVKWADPAEVHAPEQLVYQVVAADRRELLSDVLRTIYDEPGTRLTQVNASADNDGSAFVTVALEARDL